MKATTEQIQNSKDKRILGDLSTIEIYDFLRQKDGEKTRATVLLEMTYKDAIDPDSKTAHISRQSLLDRGFGKAPQAVEVDSVGGVEIIVKSGTLDDENKDKTDKS